MRLFFVTFIFPLFLFTSQSFSQSLPNGGSLNGSISVPGKIDNYTFTASAGDSVVLSVSGSIRMYMEITEPGKSSPTWWTEDFSTLNSLPSSGSYKVKIQAYGSQNTGNYTVHFVQVPGANELGTLANAQLTTGSVSAGDLDTYTFNAKQGDSVVLTIYSSQIRMYMALYAPDGSYIRSSDIGITFNSLLQTGTYTVLVSSYVAHRTGNYDLQLAHIPGANELGTLANAQLTTGSVSAGDLDTYTFNAKQGDSVVLTIYSSQIRMYIALYAPDGSYIRSSDIGITFNSLLQTGTYTVLVSSYAAHRTGNYDLQLARIPGANEHGSLSDHDFIMNTVTAGDIDTYTFEANAGDSVVLSPYSKTIRMYAAVYAPDGSYVSSSDSRYFINRLSQTGTYTVLVSSYSAFATGSYELHFAKVPGANENGQLSQSGQTGGTLTDGDIDSYTFAASEGASLNLTVTSSVRTSIVLYDPDGNPLSSSDTRISFNHLPKNGTYTVIVSPYNLPTGGPYQLGLTLNRPAISYAALGDSYSAGEGVLPFWDSNYGILRGCNRSALAYPTLVRTPFSGAPVVQTSGDTFDFYACTGAVANNIESTGVGQYGEPAQAVSSQVNSSRDLITLSIGGNDAFFARILAFCLLHDSCHTVRPFTPHSNLEIGDLFPLWLVAVYQRLVDVYKELRASAPNASILALDYPLVVGGNECVQAQVPGAPNLKLSTSEQGWMRKSNRLLNLTVRAAAAAAGVHYVGVENHFEGHGVCGDSDDWINGLLHFWPKGVFHPNAKGQLEYSKVLNRYLERVKVGWLPGYFSTGLPRNPSPISAFEGAMSIGPLPSFGELSVKLVSVPASCGNSDGVIVPGAFIDVNGKGFEAQENVSLSMRVNNQSVSLGTLRADAAGDIQGQVQVPGSATPFREVMVKAFGKGANGQGHLLTAVVELAASLTNDQDNDNIPDGCDNCPGISNTSQLDSDDDQLGDACDACPFEAVNDEDRDGVCAPTDTCPLDPDNDIDADGVCAPLDNCAITPNPNQTDSDGDGVGDACESLTCHNVKIKSRTGGRGEVVHTLPNCGSGGYFEGTNISLSAKSYPGQFFTGWTGDSFATGDKISYRVTQSGYLVANFCDTQADADSDHVADNCDDCPEIYDPNQNCAHVRKHTIKRRK